MLIRAERLQAAVAQMLRAAGTEQPAADLVAADLLEANLQGHDSHGVQLAPRYVLNVLAGKLDPNATARVVRREGAMLVVDGGMGFGQVVGRQAMDMAIAAAREAAGVGLLALRNTHHLGRIGAYGERAAAAGLLSIHFVNAVSGPPVVAPFRGSEARFGTNPICIAVPPATPGAPPLVLDFATSAIAIGKVRVAHAAGKPVPEGCLVDHAGRPTTDPAAMYGGDDGPRGALLPFGAHKGSGLALMCEILAGALTGGGTNQPATPKDRGIVNGMFAIVLDPARFGDTAAFRAETAAMVAHVKTSAPGGDQPVLVAGEQEQITRAGRLRTGIPVPEATWEELCAAAAEVGIGRAELATLAGV